MDEPADEPADLPTVFRNCLQYHMNEISANISDSRDFVRTWRRRLRDIQRNEQERYTQFLVRPTEELDTVSRHTRLLRELNHPMANTNSEWLRTNIHPVETNDVMNTLAHDICMPFETLQHGIRNSIVHYHSTVQELFAAEQRLANKLHTIEQLHTWLHAMPVDDSEESQRLQTTLANYVQSVYNQQGIHADYTQFCSLFARFSALRSIFLPLQTTDTSISPLCTICTAERVTYTLIPCGHTFCNSCCQKQRWNCYICRTEIRERQRIYFS